MSLAALIVASILLIAGLNKVARPREFTHSGPAQVLPFSWRRLAAVITGTAEAALGLFLILGIASPFSAYAAAGLLLAFVPMLMASERSKEGCGCLPLLDGTPLLWHASFNIMLAVICLGIAAPLQSGVSEIALSTGAVGIGVFLVAGPARSAWRGTARSARLALAKRIHSQRKQWNNHGNPAFSPDRLAVAVEGKVGSNDG